VLVGYLALKKLNALAKLKRGRGPFFFRQLPPAHLIDPINDKNGSLAAEF